MTIHVKQRLDDGAVVLHDAADGAEFVIRAEQWDQLDQLPPSEQRTRVEQFVLENRADPTGGRTERDENARETAQNASSGEAHQEQERS